MGLFKKHKADVKTEVKEAAGSTGRKKGKNILHSLFHESVWESVADDLKNNDQFALTQNGKPVSYVCIALDVNDIGGFDKKSKRDATKGAMIECISSGRIQTYITSDFLDNDLIVIIPTAATIRAMDEFSVLSENTKYTLCKIDLDGNMELLDKKVTYREINDFIQADGKVEMLLDAPKSKSSDDEDDDDFETDDDDNDEVSDRDDDFENDDDEIDDTSDEQDSESEEADNNDSIPEKYDDNVEDSDDTEEVTAASQPVEPMPQEPVAPAPQPVFEPQPQPDAYEQAMAEPEEQQESTLPSQWTMDAVTRKFYADDLGLEVTTEPFDAQFMSDSGIVPFDENRPSGWLNDQLNEMGRRANVELFNMRKDNLFRLRSYYFKLMSSQCDRIQQELDINNPQTQYGEMFSKLTQEKDAALESCEQIVNAKRNQLEEDWKHKLQEIGLAAARDAQRKYREQYTFQHEEQKNSMESQVKAGIEADYDDGKQELFERRRNEASVLLDMSINEVLAEVTEMYKGLMEGENARRQELADEIQKFLDDNRKDDIDRIRVLDEQQKQATAADRVLSEQTAKIRKMSEEFNTKKKELQEEIAALRRENQQRIEACQSDADRQVKTAKDERDALQRQYDNLLEKYENLDKMKDEQYKLRLEEKDGEIEAWKSRNEHTEEVHRRNSTLAIFLIVAIAIACISIGYITGEWANNNRQAKNAVAEYQETVNEYEDSMNADQGVSSMIDTSSVEG